MTNLSLVQAMRLAALAASNSSLAMRRTMKTMPAALPSVARRIVVVSSACTWPVQPQTASHAASDAATHNAISTAFARRETIVDARIGISGAARPRIGALDV
ncbi:hypothetical protein BURK_035754 [Burkholderia sp. SJ98]|nr:hypothetical protein BURK_035754 [Burkholderia sp. SJ98]